MNAHWRMARLNRQAHRRFRKEIGLPSFSWRSWAHHPFANTRFLFWNWMPHRPDWSLEDCTIGDVGHDGWSDAAWGYLFVRCVRCGVERDSTIPPNF